MNTRRTPRMPNPRKTASMIVALACIALLAAGAALWPAQAAHAAVAEVQPLPAFDSPLLPGASRLTRPDGAMRALPAPILVAPNGHPWTCIAQRCTA